MSLPCPCMSFNVTVLIDHPESYLHGYVPELLDAIRKRGHAVRFLTNPADIRAGDMLFILGCKSILSKEMLSRHRHNLVVHPSKLPEGRGHAALVRKILEGENTVFLTLFEATEEVDGGDCYFQEPITFEGHELSDEIRRRQTMKVFELVLQFLDAYPHVQKKKQAGTPTFSKRRTPEDSELDVDKTIREQFNLLRIVDNKHYPAFFMHKGRKYILHIFKDNAPK